MTRRIVCRCIAGAHGPSCPMLDYDPVGCETCGRELHERDNIIGRWCDDVCADGGPKARREHERQEGAE